MLSANKRAAVKDIAATFVTKLVLVTLKLGLGVVTARVLGTQGRGVFYMAVQTAGVANTLGSLSVYESLIYSISSRRTEREEIFSTAVLLIGLLGIGTFAGLCILWPLLPTNLVAEGPTGLFWVVVLLVPPGLVELVCAGSLRGLCEFRSVNAMGLVTRTCSLLTVIVSLFALQQTASSALGGFVAAAWLNALAYLLLLFSYSRAWEPVSWQRMARIVRWGGFVHLATILNDIEYRLDVFILLYYVDTAAVGVYSVGVALAQALWYATNSINSVLYPYLSAAAPGRRGVHAAIGARYTFYVALLVLIPLASIGLPLVRALYGTPFEEAYFVFLALIPGLLADVLYRTLGSWAKSAGLPRLLSAIASGALALNIILNLLLIPRLGLFGAAIASSVSYATRSACLLIAFVRSSSQPLRSIFLLDCRDLELFRRIAFDFLSFLKQRGR